MSQPEPLTEQQLDEIAGRTNAATSGPWKRKAELASHIVYVDNEDGTFSVLWNAEWATEADAEFTAHAPDDVRALLAEVRRQRAELAAVHAFLDEQELAARAFELPTPAWVEAVRAASGFPVAPLGASQSSEAPVEGGTATRPPTGRVGDSVETEPPNPYANGVCTYGEDQAPGSGCIKPAGHNGAHLVTPGDTDDDL